MSRSKSVISKLHDIWEDQEEETAKKFNTHLAKGANEAGYSEVLVRGTQTFSYGYSLIIDEFTSDFLQNGYIKFSLLRPIHPNRNIKITLDRNINDFSMEYMDEKTKKVYTVSRGSYYMNNKFIKDHCFKQYVNNNNKINDTEYNKLINKKLVRTPLNKNTSCKLHDNFLEIFPYKIPSSEAIKYADDVGRDRLNKLIHIGYVSDLIVSTLFETFPYENPVIHTGGEIQFVNKNNYLRNMKVGQTFKTYGKIVKIWKKKNNYWLLMDALLTDQYNNSIALVRYKAIYDSDNYKLNAKL